MVWMNDLGSEVVKRFEQSAEPSMRVTVTQEAPNDLYIEGGEGGRFFSLEISLLNVLLERWRTANPVLPLSVLVSKMTELHAETAPSVIWMSVNSNDLSSSIDGRKYMVAATNAIPEFNGTSYVFVHKICALLSALTDTPLELELSADGLKVMSCVIAPIMERALNEARDTILTKYGKDIDNV